MPSIDPVILRFEEWRRGDDCSGNAVFPVLIKYTAKWCGPCKAISFESVVESLKHLGIQFAEIDVDAHPDAVSYFGVSSIPAFVLLVPDGKKRKHLGPYNTANLRILKSWVEVSLSGNNTLSA